MSENLIQDATKKWSITNNSSRKLTDKEIELLSLGLNFGLTPKKFPLVEYITATEVLCKSLEDTGVDEDIENAQKIRNLLLSHIRKGFQMRIKNNLSVEEREILKGLRDHMSIIICPADKGKNIVVEDRDAYMEKMQKQVDEGDYKPAKGKEKTLLNKIHRKLVAQLKKMGMTEFKDRRHFLVTAPVLANMYLLIKVHKKNFPGRAVVSQIDDPTYNICKELTKILQPISSAGKSYIKNTYALKAMLSDINLDEDCLMASLDIVGLYPSVPVKKALEIVRKKLEEDETLQSRTEWKVDDIMTLLEISLETHFKTLDGKIWTQTDGCPIGKSISGEIAEIYMDWFEKNYVFTEQNDFQIIFWKRMRDDVFLIWKKGDANLNTQMGSDELDRFLWKLNGYENRIQFTLEREKEGILAFLDMLIKRGGNSFTTKVYRKETHTQKYSHWRSNHSRAVLLGILKGLIHRAHLLCDLKEDLLDELNLLRDVFISNGYPTKLVNKTIDDSWAIELKKALLEAAQKDEENEQSEYHNVLHAPYIQGFSEKLQKDLRKLGIGFVMKKGETLKTKLCKMKPKVEKEDKKDVDYIISCQTCQMKYLGETSQQFKDRKYQHKKDIEHKNTNNGIYCHLKKNKKHKIAWEQAIFIDRDSHYMRRKIKESIYINALDPSEKPTKIMNLEKGVKIGSCWNEFNSEIRKSLK